MSLQTKQRKINYFPFSAENMFLSHAQSFILTAVAICWWFLPLALATLNHKGQKIHTQIAPCFLSHRHRQWNIRLFVKAVQHKLASVFIYFFSPLFLLLRSQLLLGPNCEYRADRAYKYTQYYIEFIILCIHMKKNEKITIIVENDCVTSTHYHIQIIGTTFRDIHCHQLIRAAKKYLWKTIEMGVHLFI